MFHKTSTKLAGLYLAVMMVISLFFSINVYQLSVQEFDRGLRRPGPALNRGPEMGLPSVTRDQILQEREQQYETAKSRVLGRLVVINLLILVGGGVLSYYLALRTLRPIEEAHESLERFTADASHELRTPIAAMQTEIEVALMNPKLTLKESKEKLKSNLEELAKLTMLSEGLLRLARLENSDITGQDVLAETVIRRAIGRVLPLAEKKHILIKTPDNIRGKVVADEDSLVEAFVIVLDNAIKYSNEKTEVEITSRQERHQIIIQVKDNGIGIKATALPHIFERFYRADSARSKQTDGYGLGLAIAKNIIDMHEGEISITSASGKGTTVTISLPLKT
jgi:signal transduction histidine kinase